MVAESERIVEDDETLFMGYTGLLSMTLSLGWLATLLGREMLPPILPTIIHDLAISSSHAGFALTLLWAIYAVMHFPSGQLSDQLTRTTVIMVGLGVIVVGFGVLS